ncbi:hypothetical protein [Rhizobium hainanense]|uniref:Uncharacterized protein n=1 Tax=Rhizobium hainanense TaxID=52131 RepID=A0A1C3WD68_9HYPH|nr:hypothetical protein [Rhizobium hainanense]SCB37758.1 hypothetical protein GA0061100_11593 [Rhizobium hainanense]
MAISKTLFSLVVEETDRSRAFWATQPWIDAARRDEVAAADVLVAPWVDLKDGHKLFPQGAADFIKDLRAAAGSHSVVVAVERAQYEEIALYSDHWRLPTLICSQILLPIVIGLLTNHIDRSITEDTKPSIVEMELIVEGSGGKCIAVKYKGPPEVMIAEIEEQVKRCLPKGNGRTPKTSRQ